MRSFHNRVALTSSVLAGAIAVPAQALGLGVVGMRGLHDGVPGAGLLFVFVLELLRNGLIFFSKGLVNVLARFAFL